jgi:hypothetical protein
VQVGAMGAHAIIGDKRGAVPVPTAMGVIVII